MRLFNQMKIWSLIFFVCVFTISINYGQWKNTDNLQISLLTCGPGDQLYSTFGHSAVRVKDQSKDVDVVYNYGTFDDSDPMFYLNFLRGKMDYMLTRTTYDRFLLEYNYYKRWVEEQTLQLDSIQKMEMVTYLEKNALPENRVYPYDFFFDNCATRIRDIIPVITDNEVRWPAADTSKTFRDLLHEHLISMPWSEFGIDLIIGAKADKVTTYEERSFLPIYLSKLFGNANMGSISQPLAGDVYQVLMFPEEVLQRKTRPWFTPHIIWILLIVFELSLIFIIKKSKWVKRYNKLFFFALGLGSLLMLGLWFATDHQATALNWNIIWMSPLFLVFPWMKKGPLKRGVGYFIIAGNILAFLNIIYQFLPQSFNHFNILLILLIIWKVWKCLNKGRRKSIG